LVDLTFPWSDSSGNADSETVSLLVGDGVSSVGPGSNGSGSFVEDEPLSVVLWLVVSDSESVLVGSNVLLPVQGSEGAHSRLDLESSAVWKWLSWVGVGSLVDIPGLVQTVVAAPHDGVSQVSVDISVDIKAELVVELDVLSGSVVPNDLLNGLTSVGSDDNSDSSSEALSVLSRENVGSSGPGSDGSGSGIEGPPLLRALWVVVLDSDSVLVSSNVLSPEQGSVSAHSRFDLESFSISNWVWWVSEWDLWLGIDEPSLVDTVVASVPVD